MTVSRNILPIALAAVMLVLAACSGGGMSEQEAIAAVDSVEAHYKAYTTDSAGVMLQELSYDAWGALRDPDTHIVYEPGTEPELLLGRGYCGHEHLTQFGLINMNARLYDPALGRFLSPDPQVQYPDNTQNFNRYSYCMNNPLKYVDQDGEIFWLIPVLVGAAIGGVMSAGTYALAAAITHQKFSWNSFWKSMGMGAFAGALSGGLGLLAGGAVSGIGITNQIGYNLFSQAFTSTLTSTVFGQNMDWTDMVGIVAAAGLGYVLPKFKALKASPLVNTLAETGFNTVRNATTGALQGGIKAMAYDNINYLWNGIAGGAISGASRTLMANAIFGAPFQVENSGITTGLYRTGGLAGLMGFNDEFGLTIGQNVYVGDAGDYTTIHHEYAHILQQLYSGGWTKFYTRLFSEYFKYGFEESYTIPGTLEYEANEFARAW